MNLFTAAGQIWEPMGKFLRHFRNIFTIKSFPMKKFERSDDPKLHPCIGCWWLLTSTKIINQQNLNHSFWPLFEFCHFRKKKFYHNISFYGKSNFLPVLDSVPRFWKRCPGVCCQTMTHNEKNLPKHLILIQNFTFWEIFQVSGCDKTQFPEVTRLRFLFTRYPLLFTHWLS